MVVPPEQWSDTLLGSDTMDTDRVGGLCSENQRCSAQSRCPAAGDVVQHAEIRSDREEAKLSRAVRDGRLISNAKVFRSECLVVTGRKVFLFPEYGRSCSLCRCVVATYRLLHESPS